MDNFIPRFRFESMTDANEILSFKHFEPFGKMLLMNHVALDSSLKDDIIKGAIKGLSQSMRTDFAVMQALGLQPSLTEVDLAKLPPKSFAIQFEFELLDYWFSRDDHPFYPIENPVRKEVVFKVPEMGASGWKGVFRQACLETSAEEVSALFGAPLEEESGKGGTLHFFPSFFEKGSHCQSIVEPYVLNPQDRSTKAGRNKGPITLEVVKPGSRGRFLLLYTAPRTGVPDTHGPLIATLLEQVFTISGFGAKTSAGFGRAAILNYEASSTTAQAIVPKKNIEGCPVQTLPHNRFLFRDKTGAVSCKAFTSFSELEGLLTHFCNKEK